MLLTGAMPTNSPTKMDQSLLKAEDHLTLWYSQGFPFQFLDQLKSKYCVNSRMFSEEDLSGEERNRNFAVIKSNKKEKECIKMKKTLSFHQQKRFQPS